MHEVGSSGSHVGATTAGNHGELSIPAVRVRKMAQMVDAEDTGNSGIMVTRAGGQGQMTSLTEHNLDARTPGLLEAAETRIVALVSDAGTPVIADPGARLIEAAHRAGVRVLPIPGPSALAAAISVSGFEGSDVHFLGFLPKGRGERVARLTSAAAGAGVLVFFESPHRLKATLAELAEHLANPEVVVCRELTKLHEEVVRGRADELATQFDTVRGECTVVVRCAGQSAQAGSPIDATALLDAMKRAGAKRSNAATEVARLTGAKRDELYAHWDAL